MPTRELGEGVMESSLCGSFCESIGRMVCVQGLRTWCHRKSNRTGIRRHHRSMNDRIKSWPASPGACTTPSKKHGIFAQSGSQLCRFGVRGELSSPRQEPPYGQEMN